jgi:hypothetical protein
MKRKRIFFSILLFLFIVGGTYAQKVGTTSFQFLKVMPTARAAALGDAFSAIAEGSDAVFWNPAGISTTTKHDLNSTMTLWLFDIKQTAISYSINLNSLGGMDLGWIGFQMQYVDYGSIEETRVEYLGNVLVGDNQWDFNPGLTGRSFSPSAYVLGITYAQRLTDKFSTGITAKYVKESLFGDKTMSFTNASGIVETYKTYASVFLFDFGMDYNTGFRSIRMGVSIQNFGPSVKFAKEEYPAPLAFRLGGAADVIGETALLMPNEKNRLTVAYDLFHPNDYAQQMHFGLEYAFSEMVFLRAGYKLNYDSEKLTYGGGIRYGVGAYDLSFDYSYGSMGNLLGQVHRLSLGVKIK